MHMAIKIFSKLQDMRQEKKVLHKLLDIVIITITAVMCGCTDWKEVASFGEARLQVLRRYLDLENGAPSHDTLRRVMGMIHPEHLETCYRQWVSAILPQQQLPPDNARQNILSIDGKTVRGSGKPGCKPIHMVSAWSSQAGITLAQLKTEEKSNEITAIPELLEVLDLAGCIITIDAMGCQTDIASRILQKGGDYVLSCKDNQPNLHKEILSGFASVDEDHQKLDAHIQELEDARDAAALQEGHIAQAKRNEVIDRVKAVRAEQDASAGYTKSIKVEKNHGRIEKRTYELIEYCEDYTRLHDFKGARSIGRVTCHVTFPDGKERTGQRLYVTSLSGPDAHPQFVQAARKHWGIENSCHWVLDVTFGEDACRTRDVIASQNLSLARKLALALAKKVPDEVVERYSHDKAKYTSLKKRLFLAGLYPDFMVEILLASA
jgi:predicted transposase YbfD/YdcC